MSRAQQVLDVPLARGGDPAVHKGHGLIGHEISGGGELVPQILHDMPEAADHRGDGGIVFPAADGPYDRESLAGRRQYHQGQEVVVVTSVTAQVRYTCW